MVFTLTQDLIAEPQQAAEGMCLADWQALEAFNVDQPEQSAQLIHPRVVKTRAEGLLKTIAIERPGDSGNAGGFGQQVPSPCRHIVLHWWGPPVGQSHDGVVSWLRNPVSLVSAHYVVSPGRVTQILPLTTPSWANGNAAINATSITIEADPNDVAGTIITIVELLVQLVRDGAVHPDYRLSGHRDHYSTACPGDYYPRLGAIRTAATTTRLPATSGTVNQEEDNMPITQQDADLIAATILARQVPDLQPGGGKTTLGETIAEARAHHLDVLRTVGQTPDAILDAPVARGGRGTELGPETSLRAMVSHADDHTIQLIDRIGSTVVSATGADPEVVKRAVREAIESLTVTVEVTK